MYKETYIFWFWFLVQSSGSLIGAVPVLLDFFVEDTLKQTKIQLEQITGFGKSKACCYIFIFFFFFFVIEVSKYLFTLEQV